MNRLLLASVMAFSAIAGYGVTQRAWIEDIVNRRTLATGVWGTFRATYDGRLAANPADYEARILKAATYLGELVENPDLNELMRAYGGWFDPKTITFRGKLSFAGAPPSNAAVDRAAAVGLPALDAAEYELAQIPADWSGSVTIRPGDYPLDEPVRFDRGDLLYLKSMLAAARAQILYAQGYDCTLDNAKSQQLRTANVLEFPELGFAPAVDGDRSEWATRAESFVDSSGIVAQFKTGSHGGWIYMSFGLANPNRIDDFDFELKTIDAATGKHVYQWCYFPLSEGRFDGVTRKGWPYAVFRRGTSVEIGVQIPAGMDIARTHLDFCTDNYERIVVPRDPARQIAVDGSLSDWSGVQVHAVDGSNTRTGRILRRGDEIAWAIESVQQFPSSGNENSEYDGRLRVDVGRTQKLEIDYSSYEVMRWDSQSRRYVYTYERRHDVSLRQWMFDEDYEEYVWDKQSGDSVRVKRPQWRWVTIADACLDDFELVTKGSVLECKATLPDEITCELGSDDMFLRYVSHHPYRYYWMQSIWWDCDIDGSDMDKRKPSLPEMMEANPDCLKKVRSVPKLTSSRNYLRTAFDLLQAADSVIAARTDRFFHFFDYDPLLAPEQDRVRSWVAEAKASLDAPQTHDLDGDLLFVTARNLIKASSYAKARNSAYGSGKETYFLGALFRGGITRANVPYVTRTDIPVIESIPDATVSGLAPNMSVDRALGACGNQAEYARIFTGPTWPGTVPRRAGAPIWMVKCVYGGGVVTYRAEMVAAKRAKLLCYVDGVLQMATAYSGESEVKTIQLGDVGEHEIAWKFDGTDSDQVVDLCPVQDIRGAIVDSLTWRNANHVTLFPEQDTTEFAGDAVYNGWLRDASGAVVGILEVKASRAANGRPSKVTGSVTWLATGKKEKLPSELVAPGAGASYQGITLGGLALNGSFRGYAVQGARDTSRSKDKEEKAAAAASLAAKAGVRTFALMTDAGFAAFTATVDKKGKCKFAGTLPDGTKVSYSGKGVLGADVLAIPLVYKRKASVGMVLWVYDGETAEITDAAPLVLTSGTAYTPGVVPPSAKHRLADGSHRLASADGVGQGFSVAGKKWIFPKKDLNPVELKMSFADRTGAVKGSYSILDGKKKIRHTVFGVVVDDVMFGSSFIKKVGSCPVWTE